MCPGLSSEAAPGRGPTGPVSYRCLFNQEMNSEADGSVQGQTSGNRAPPRSVGAGACAIALLRLVLWVLRQAATPLPRELQAAYLRRSPGPPSRASAPGPSRPAGPVLAVLGPGQGRREGKRPPSGTLLAKQTQEELAVPVLCPWLSCLQLEDSSSLSPSRKAVP